MPAIFRPALIAVAAIALSACDSSDDPANIPIQVIHAVANAPSVAVSRDSGPFVSSLEFKQSTSFVPVPPSSTQISVDANLPGGDQVTVIGPTTVPLLAGTRVSVVAAGSVGSVDTPIQPIVVSGPSTAVGANDVRVNVVHAAAGAPPVDIHVTAPMDPVIPADAIAGGSTPFGASSGALEVPAGDYRVRVTLPGDTDPLFDSGTIPLPGGADLIVLAVDNTVAGRSDGVAVPITLLVVNNESTSEIFSEPTTAVPNGTPADVRIVHAVPDLNGVDIYVNDPMAINPPAIGGLDFPDAVPTPVPGDSDSYLELPEGTLNVLVTVAGNPGIIGIPATDLELEAGKQYTVFAANTLAAGIVADVREDDSRSIATESRVRIIHLAPSAGLVDIYVTEPMADITNLDPTFEDVDFQDETGYVSLTPSDYDVTVTLANTKTVAIGPATGIPTITVEAGGVYTAVARDPDVDIANDPFNLILLDDF